MRRLVFGVCASIVLMLPSAAKAAPVGTFSIVGLDPVVVSATPSPMIDWGTVFFNPIGTGDFAVLDGTMGELADLDQAVHPVGVAFVLDNFLTADAAPAWNFQLNFIEPGTGTPAECTDTPGDVCTPPVPGGSPFTITNDDAGGASVSLSVSGTIIDMTDDSTSSFRGIFTTQFVDMTAAEILAELATEGSVTSSHSASFRAETGPVEVPEPASMLLLGAGLIGLGFVARRRRQ